MQGRAATACSFGSVAGAVSDQYLLRCVVCGPRYSFFDDIFFFFHFFFGHPAERRHLSQTKPTKSPTLLSLTPVAALPSADTLRPAPAVAALLNASVFEDSHRPIHNHFIDGK
jgi:hypothetical protein